MHSWTHKNSIVEQYVHTHGYDMLARTQSVWLLLTVVPGHSVPEAETCRVLHRCGWSELQCAWAPGHRGTQGGEAGKGGSETEIHNQGGKQQRMTVCTHRSPLQVSELGHCLHLPPSRSPCRGQECLKVVRNFLRKCQTRTHPHICNQACNLSQPDTVNLSHTQTDMHR